jgi:hypothetical protein
MVDPVNVENLTNCDWTVETWIVDPVNVELTVRLFVLMNPVCNVEFTVRLFVVIVDPVNVELTVRLFVLMNPVCNVEFTVRLFVVTVDPVNVENIPVLIPNVDIYAVFITNDEPTAVKNDKFSLFKVLDCELNTVIVDPDAVEKTRFLTLIVDPIAVEKLRLLTLM